MDMRILILVMVVVMFAGCADEVQSFSSATQQTRCQQGQCFPDDDGGGWIDPTSPEAAPAAGAVFNDIGSTVDRCKWRGACVLCYNNTAFPYGNGAAYACQVCVDASKNRCGEYNTTLDDWAIA